MMKKILLLAFFIKSHFLNAQSFTVEIPQNNSEKFEKLLMQIENISFENFKFISKKNDEKYLYKIIISQYKNGNKIKENVLFESNLNTNYGNFENNELDFSIIGKTSNNKEYQIIFNINKNLYLKESFVLDDSERFSIKHFFNQKMDFIKGKKALLFALVKPIKIEENLYRDCDFNSVKDKPEEWFAIFGIKDYVIFEMVIE